MKKTRLTPTGAQFVLLRGGQMLMRIPEYIIHGHSRLFLFFLLLCLTKVLFILVKGIMEVCMMYANSLLHKKEQSTKVNKSE